ncbi:hypothetical protein [Ornithinibacillus halotolerans]|uniref:DUF4367 domain-containing protein n=1 Tax=Ornithinibacillus halotolerans TaxID=1274357 RepID=A0A916RN32_9BACI|nr:hypothetical protein [Ornithinibacillus halotolerans]GGA62345.1 hypothetical protein GCM10008025_02880 [Ornithinibacillus halotolerans]
MTFKKSAILSISGLCLGIVIVFIFSFITETNSSAYANTGQLKVVSEKLIERSNDSNLSKEKLTKVPFHAKVKTPTSLPFEADKIFDEVQAYTGESVESITHYYNTNKNSYISIGVTDENVIPADEGIVDLQTKKGTVQYFDNGVFQFIFINEDGLFYTIKAQKNIKKPELKFSKDELISIVTGLKAH